MHRPYMGDQHSLSQSPYNPIYRDSCLLHHRAGRFFLRLFRSKQSFEQSEIRNNRVAAKNCILVQNVCPLFWILSGYLFVKCASRQARVSSFFFCPLPACSVAYIEKRVTPAWQGFFFQMWVKKYGFGQKYVFFPKNKLSKVFF